MDSGGKPAITVVVHTQMYVITLLAESDSYFPTASLFSHISMHRAVGLIRHRSDLISLFQ